MLMRCFTIRVANGRFGQRRSVLERRGVFLTPFLTRVFFEVLKSVIASLSIAGTDGGTRTHTEIALQRILSPLRLPFRHTGALTP